MVEAVHRASVSFRDQTWLVDITPVPLGGRPPAEIVNGELIVKRSDLTEVISHGGHSTRCRVVGARRPRYTLLRNRFSFSCQTFTVALLILPEVRPKRPKMA